jgi:hypothetical protein
MGPNMESICGPACDPANMGNCLGVIGLPPPSCLDSEGDGTGNCVFECSLDPCPMEMTCVGLTQSFSMCMWP